MMEPVYKLQEAMMDSVSTFDVPTVSDVSRRV